MPSADLMANIREYLKDIRDNPMKVSFHFEDLITKSGYCLKNLTENQLFSVLRSQECKNTNSSGFFQREKKLADEAQKQEGNRVPDPEFQRAKDVFVTHLDAYLCNIKKGGAFFFQSEDPCMALLAQQLCDQAKLISDREAMRGLLDAFSLKYISSKALNSICNQARIDFPLLDYDKEVELERALDIYLNKVEYQLMHTKQTGVVSLRVKSQMLSQEVDRRVALILLDSLKQNKPIKEVFSNENITQVRDKIIAQETEKHKDFSYSHAHNLISSPELMQIIKDAQAYIASNPKHESFLTPYRGF